LKRVAIYAVISAALIAVAAWILTLVYSGADAQRAIMVSAVTALSVQVLAFALLRLWTGPAVMMAWGIGALARFLVIVVYALVVLRAAVLPLEPALVSLASFFVICTLIEPFMLERSGS
jgi:hypothetical protein